MKIEFLGEISQTGKKYIIKQLDKSYRWGMLGFPFVFLLVCLPFYNTEYEVIGIIATIIIFAFFIILSICPRLHYNPKNLTNHYPFKITIENETITVEGKGEDAYICRQIADIKKVIDCGNFYYIKFYFPYNYNCVCQKNLISYGTIEEFEQIFEDKIVRKVK